MNKIKNVIVLTLCLIATSVLGAETTSPATSKGILGLFTANELYGSVGMTYSDAKEGKFNPTVGASYFVSKNFGIRGSTTLSVSDISAFNNAEFVVIARLPIWVVSPYVGGGISLQTASTEEVAPVVVLGVDTRINKHFSLFAEGSHSFRDKNVNFNDWLFKGGISFRIF